jgi:hypothetical protein
VSSPCLQSRIAASAWQPNAVAALAEKAAEEVKLEATMN